MNEMNDRKQILDNWRFRAAGEKAWMPAQVPGCVHTDLLRNGKIPDPFYGTNERDLQWIDKQDWEYETEFDIAGSLMASGRLELVFEGLDTYADVDLNGRRLLSADNMFRTYRIDVKEWVRPSGNRLRVRFRSPIREGLARLEQHGYGLPATNDDSVTGGLGDRKVSAFTRKAPYHYGWDWGPRFVTSGIWRTVALEGWSDCRIADLFIRQDEVSARRANVTAIVQIDSDFDGVASLTLTTEDLRWDAELDLHAGRNVIEVPCVIAEPRLWWCRGMGEQPLYHFQATLSREGVIADVRRVRTGLRQIRLVRQPDAHGTTFYFELNGVPVFAKGANHIPGDSFLAEMTESRYRHEIASAVEANFNMLRVWGGGIYEHDAFYDLCDEYGIMVWQDFMFACSMYPGDESFLESVRLEAEDNLQRLRNHPCIVLWCGNNEIDIAWSHYIEKGGWGWKQAYTQDQRERIWADYESLFHRVLPEAVSKMVPGAAYWPSSPMQALTGDANQHAHNSSTHGDVHYWAVWHAKEPFERYNDHVGRFMSEYGFQSFPACRTIRSYASASDMALNSEVMLHHQKHPSGNQLIHAYAEMYLKAPRDFPSFLYLSQVLQGEAMKMAIEAHRRRKPFCMGSLYWQINDCWPVASWSSIDYFGRWKAVQYYARRSFRDVIVSIEEKAGRLAVHAVSDRLVPVRGQLVLQLVDFGGQPLKDDTVDAAIGPNTAAIVHESSVSAWLSGHDPSRIALIAEWKADDGECLGSAIHYFASTKNLALEQPGIVVQQVVESNGVALVLSASRLAKQVVLETEEEGIFTDNYFDLIPGKPKKVKFYKRGNGQTPFEWHVPGQVTVRSMVDFILS
jgi:beta-mannosidase